MGDDPPNWEGVGSIPPLGSTQADGEATLAREGQSVGIPPDIGRDGGGGTAGGGELRLLSPEHGRTVYGDQSHYGPVSDG